MYMQDGTFVFRTAASGTAGNDITWGAAKLTIANSGQLTTYADAAGVFGAVIQNDGNVATRYGIKVQAGADDASGQTHYLGCYDGDGDSVGYVWNNAGTFQLVDASDIRLKEDVTPTTIKGLETVNALEVIDFTRKKSKHRVIGGFSGQQVAALCPTAGSKNSDGMYGVSKADLVPTLVKAIQELAAEVKALKEAA